MAHMSGLRALLRLHNVRDTVASFVARPNQVPYVRLSTAKSNGGWQEVLDSLTPAHCNLMTNQQKLAVLQLSKLDTAFKTIVPPRLFAMVVHSIQTDSPALDSWSPADLASLLCFSRAAGLHLQRDTASFVESIEHRLMELDLSSLPLSVVTDVFKAYLADVAGHNPAATALAAELGRRASQLSARPVDQQTATAAAASVSSDASARPASRAAAVAQSALPTSPEASPTASTAVSEGRIASAAAKELSVASSALPNLERSHLQSLTSVDDVVAAVEAATAAIISVTMLHPQTGQLGSTLLQAGSAQERAAAIVRAEESIARFRALAILDLLRRADAAEAGESSQRSGKEHRSAQFAAAAAASGSAGGGGAGAGGSRGTGGSHHGGSSRSRNDWRKRLTDGTLVAAGVGAVLAVGAVATGLQAAQAPAPSHRLVALLEKASPGTMVHLLQYVIGPLPSWHDVSDSLPHSATATGTGSTSSSSRAAQGAASFTRNVTGLLKADAEQRQLEDARRGVESESASMRLLRSLWRQPEPPPSTPISPSSMGTGRSPPEQVMPAVPSLSVVGAGMEGAATATVIAAARRALCKTGLNGYSPAQLCALVELLGQEAGVAGAADSQVGPNSFWDAVLASVSSRPVTAFSVEQRVSLAHRLCRVAKGKGAGQAGPGKHGIEYSRKAGELIASMVGEPQGLSELQLALAHHPTLLTRLAHVTVSVPLEHLCLDSTLGSAPAVLDGLSAAIVQAVHEHGPDFAGSLTAQSLWTILSALERALTSAKPPPQRSALQHAIGTYPGGGPKALTELLVHKFPADVSASSSPLLAVQLLGQRSQGMRRLAVAPHTLGRAEDGMVLSIWKYVPAAYANDLWKGLLPLLDSHSGSGRGPAVQLDSAPAATHIAEQVSPTLKARTAGRALMVAAYGRGRAGTEQGSEGAASAQPGCSSSVPPSAAVQAAVAARAPHLLLTACEQLDLPAARQALTLLSEMCAADGSSQALRLPTMMEDSADASMPPIERSVTKTSASSTRRVDLARHSFALMHSANAVQLLGQAMERPEYASAADLPVAYGRLLTLLSTSLRTSNLACEPPTASAPTKLAAAGGDAQTRDITIGNTSINTLVTLWSKLLDCEAHLGCVRVGEGSRAQGQHAPSAGGDAGMGLTAWNPVTVSALRTSIALACINITGELAHRLSARALTGSSSAGVGEVARGDGAGARKKASMLSSILDRVGSKGREDEKAAHSPSGDAGLPDYIRTTLTACLERTQSLPAHVLSAKDTSLVLDRHDDMSSHNASLAARHEKLQQGSRSSGAEQGQNKEEEEEEQDVLVAARSERLARNLALLQQAVSMLQREKKEGLRPQAQVSSSTTVLKHGATPVPATRASTTASGSRSHAGEPSMSSSGEDDASAASSIKGMGSGGYTFSTAGGGVASLQVGGLRQMA